MFIVQNTTIIAKHLLLHDKLINTTPVYRCSTDNNIKYTDCSSLFEPQQTSVSRFLVETYKKRPIYQKMMTQLRQWREPISYCHCF